MSRRRVSVRDLGLTDCQGWLLRRKQERSFLGARWKRYWFVLKKSSLYWYSNKMAQQCKKKHSITASHPLVVDHELIDTEECYSEGSDQDDNEECLSTSCSLTSVQEAAESDNGEDVPPPSEALPPPPCSEEEEGPLSRKGRRGRRRKREKKKERLSLCCMSQKREKKKERLSLCCTSQKREKKKEERLSLCCTSQKREKKKEERLSLCCTSQKREKKKEERLSLCCTSQKREKKKEEHPPPDKMELLDRRLQAARLSPIGQSSQKDFRASFIRRCPDDKINEELHLLRILSSTMKAKQSELQTLDQILNDPALAAPTYRKWKLCNFLLLQEVAHHSRKAGGAAEPEDAFTTTTTT
ncbi:hypothetical protein JOQ06_004637 [Pogonophryne albipinna]|uniref:PH domain-containing protein n=1 Tax=Pogonophryne albipinna TaxID=1090488 RepID=A0AAD6AQF8_9TELE|nr:hypothetical protein JOQ06_004637 [Pogonophryne albipinna]